MDSRVPLRRRRSGPRAWALVCLVVACVVVVALSPRFGRAHPEGRYRPELAPAPLSTGCYPLPPGVHLDFPLQVRSDEDLVERPLRRLRLQYDVISDAAAVRGVTSAFTRAGYTVAPAGEYLAFRRSGAGEVLARVRPLPRRLPDSVVRGTVELLLPVINRASSDPVCSDPFATKRFADEELTP